MSRSSEKGTRIDVLISNDVYEAVQRLAIQSGAKTHHISKKVETSPTIAKLVSIGLKALDGKLPDNIDDISDKLPDTFLNSLPDKNEIVSDMIVEVSDKVMKAVDESFNKEWVKLKNTIWLERERVNILIRELTAKGVIESNVELEPVPDKTSNISDAISDTISTKDVMISDKDTILSDAISDRENIPSDDLNNSDPVAEDVSIIPEGTDIENHSPQKESLPNFYSFAGFHNFLGLTRPDKRNKANGDTAIIAAKEKGYGNWAMDTSSYKFTKTIEG